MYTCLWINSPRKHSNFQIIDFRTELRPTLNDPLSTNICKITLKNSSSATNSSSTVWSKMLNSTKRKNDLISPGVRADIDPFPSLILSSLQRDTFQFRIIQRLKEKKLLLENIFMPTSIRMVNFTKTSAYF